jgi:beta-glucanase (GH16 family)
MRFCASFVYYCLDSIFYSVFDQILTMKLNVKYFVVFLVSGMVVLGIYKMKSGSSDFFEDFNALDETLWNINRFSFAESGTEMSSDALAISKSLLAIKVDVNAVGSGKKYKGGEIGSLRFFNYGYFTVRMKNNIRHGSVSSFFIMNEWKEKDWEHREIDIEFLGKDPTAVQFTVHLYADGGRNHIYYAHVYPLGFDSSKDFHDYSIAWKKDTISWYVDGVLAHTETRIVPNVPLQIRVNHWIANSQDSLTVDWMGKVDDSTLPSFVYYDWVSYKPFD